MKKILSFILTLGLALTFVACDKEDTTSPESPKDPSYVENEENTNTPQNEDEPLKVETKNCRLYFFNINTDEILYVDKDIEVVDKALVKALSSAHKGGFDNTDLVTLHKEAEITKAKKEDGILKVYFNKEFASKMNLGSGAESGLLESLICTYGYNFDVDKVAIYSDGTLFTGVRGENPEGYYNVDLSKTKKLDTTK